MNRSFLKSLLLLLPLALAACVSPRDACINKATRDLRVVSRLISESEGILRRGYKFEERTSVKQVFRLCYDEDGKPVGCWVPEEEIERRPVAVDLTAEREKLTALKAKKAELERQARKEITKCEALPAN